MKRPIDPATIDPTNRYSLHALIDDYREAYKLFAPFDVIDRLYPNVITNQIEFEAELKLFVEYIAERIVPAGYEVRKKGRSSYDR